VFISNIKNRLTNTFEKIEKFGRLKIPDKHSDILFFDIQKLQTIFDRNYF